MWPAPGHGGYLFRLVLDTEDAVCFIHFIPKKKGSGRKSSHRSVAEIVNWVWVNASVGCRAVMNSEYLYIDSRK